MRVMVFLLFCCVYGIACTKQKDAFIQPKLIFRVKFDSTQARLNNNGAVAVLPAGHAAQSPAMNGVAADYIELAPASTTALGAGAIIYQSPTVTVGGVKAIDFSKLQLSGNNEVFYAIDIKDIPPGDYVWLRVGAAYQNFNIGYHADTTVNDSVRINQDFSGTIASFIGYNTYITTYNAKLQPITVDTTRLQGYWGFETILSGESYSATATLQGQSPDGSTTVVNTLFSSAPNPSGSNVITAAFKPGKLVIRGKETENIVIEVSLSINNSFEWKELVANGKWDPFKGEPVIDMGLRGMVPTIK